MYPFLLNIPYTGSYSSFTCTHCGRAFKFNPESDLLTTTADYSISGLNENTERKEPIPTWLLCPYCCCYNDFNKK